MFAWCFRLIPDWLIGTQRLGERCAEWTRRCVMPRNVTALWNLSLWRSTRVERVQNWCQGGNVSRKIEHVEMLRKLWHIQRKVNTAFPVLEPFEAAEIQQNLHHKAAFQMCLFHWLRLKFHFYAMPVFWQLLDVHDHCRFNAKTCDAGCHGRSSSACCSRCSQGVQEIHLWWWYPCINSFAKDHPYRTHSSPMCAKRMKRGFCLQWSIAFPVNKKQGCTKRSPVIALAAELFPRRLSGQKSCHFPPTKVHWEPAFPRTWQNGGSADRV